MVLRWSDDDDDGSFPSSIHLPYVLIGCFPIRFDGTTFQLVFGPTGPLAGSVAILSKLALAAPVEFVLCAEAAVANTLC